MEQMDANPLLDMIIRPPRNKYMSDASENNTIKEFGGKKFVKKVFTV
jgi:hypothetical protein